MKVQILSDLHLEFDLPESIPAVHADLVILAGDIHNGGDGIRWADQIFPAKVPIVYVPGNHEYYTQVMLEAKRKMNEAAAASDKQIHVLDRKGVVLPDLALRVLGVTLWTDFSLFGRSDVELRVSLDACQRYMTDFNGAISISDGLGGLRGFMPEDSLQLHQADLAWLKQALSKPFAGKTIVVTHHAPHPNSLARRFATDRVSAGFINDLTDLMGPSINLWVHGHTHDCFDYQVNGTRVFCNPRGYVSRVTGNAENTEFDWSCIVSV